MSIVVYDINTHLKNDSILESIAGKKISIFPIVATDGEKSPYIVYFYTPTVSDVESYWLRHDYLRYSVFDINVDRMFKIANRIVELLAIGNEVNTENGVLSSNYRVLSSWQTGSSLGTPTEINGLYRINLDFKVCNVVK